MRKLLLLLLTVISVSVSAQYQPSGSKVRYVNGIGLGSKLDAAFGTADSLVLYARKSDSVLVFKYGNTAKALQYAVNATGILWGNGTTVNGSLYTFANDSVITFRGTKFLQNVSTTQNPSIYSLFLGFGAGGNFMNGTKGYANTAIGYYAGGALQSNVSSEASSNTLVGYYAGAGMTTGTANSALGTAALGSANANKTVAIGWHAMESATNGDNTIAIGSLALQYNTSLSEHVAVGGSSLRNNSTGLRNTAIGYNTLNANTTGSYNVALGWDAMGDDAVGDYNTVLGYNAGNTLFAGSNNTIIGARVSLGSINNSIAIGNGNGTIKAYNNNSSWDLYDTVKANRFVASGLTVNDFLLGNGGSTQDVVRTTGVQTIAGVKTFSTTIASTKTNGSIFSSISGNTSTMYHELANTGGSLVYGLESSTGVGIFLGSSAYASVFGSANNTATEFASNGIVRISISGAGETYFKKGIVTDNYEASPVAWEFGKVYAPGSLTLNTTNYISVRIGGIAYKLALVN